MIFERTIATTEKESRLRERTMAFFQQAGYTRAALQPALVIERGSLIGSLVSSSPRDWLARVIVTIPAERSKLPAEASLPPIIVRLEVSTSLQWVTQAERAFFERELDCLETALTGGVVDCSASEQAFQAAFSGSLKGNLFILGSALLGLLLFLLVFRSGAGLVVGLAVGLFAGQWGAARLVRGGDPVILETGAEAAARLRHELRLWGMVVLILGLLHLLSAGLLNAPWGVTLILLGLVSFFITAPSLFIVYAITLIWAALTNGIGGWRAIEQVRPILTVLSLFQVVLALQVFRRFTLYRKAAGDQVLNAPGLPALSAGLGLFSLLAYLALFALVFTQPVRSGGPASPALLIFLESVFANLGVLAAAAGLAGLLGRRPASPKGLTALGLVSGALVAIFETILILLG